ncbi:hypothetical protein INT47_003517 [Mucor saturninus]|uniref:3'-5' exonuclease domain-containing protein n=1 Tax=Mucor saturninus TaxID=64648 RepID=A0A8H7QKD7_9FUNG|nr:hypothetical protein INT47_003517 [Mucor saturninus]
MGPKRDSISTESESILLRTDKKKRGRPSGQKNQPGTIGGGRPFKMRETIRTVQTTLSNFTSIDRSKASDISETASGSNNNQIGTGSVMSNMQLSPDMIEDQNNDNSTNYLIDQVQQDESSFDEEMDDDLLDVDSEDEVDDDDNDDDGNTDDTFFGSNNNSDDTDSNEKSVINKCLRRLQEEYKGCTVEKPPLPYQNKTFWVYQPMPSFSLKESSDVNNFSYYVMSKRYVCSAPPGSPKHTFKGYDDSIVRQLPLRCQADFSAFITHKLGISKMLMNFMRALFQNSLGPHRMSKILEELHHLKHDTMELQYLDAVKYFNNSTIHGFFGSSTVEKFSAYSDKMRYGGVCSSSKYISHVYTSFITLLRSKMERETMVKDGEILNVDHSFKIIEKIAKDGGRPVFQALYTVCNEYEEVRAMAFVPTKGQAHVKPLLCALKRSYELYGHTMPKIVFTDNVVGDQKLFEDIFPSLIIDVKHVDGITVEVTDQEHELPVYEIPSDVTVECLSSIDSINFFMQTILNDIRDRRTRVNIGFDCEWYYTIKPSYQKKIAIIQIAYQKKVFIIQTKHFDVDPTSGLKILPASLKTLLLTRSITKIGKSIGGDFKKIQRDFHGDFVCLGSFEISTLCKDKDVVARANLSLADVCKAALS